MREDLAERRRQGIGLIEGPPGAGKRLGKITREAAGFDLLDPDRDGPPRVFADKALGFNADLQRYAVISAVAGR